MTEKLACWAKGLAEKNHFIGIVIRLCYEICVQAQVQSAVHIVAACLLGAFCYKNGALFWKFIIPFAVIYLLIIIVFGISNQHRKIRNDSIRGYEISYPQISKALQEECRKDVELYNVIANKSISEINDYYAAHDVYTEACFRVCAAVDELLQGICTTGSFRVMTFLRTTLDKDEYHINAYSPQEPAPEAYGVSFDLERLKGNNIRKKSIPVHARPFLNKRFEPIIYTDKEVKREYSDFNMAHPTKLHISIPCSVNSMVVTVLQITSYDNCLGSKSNIQDLIKNVLVIYTSYLKTVYMHQIEHEKIAKALEKCLMEV